MENDESLGIYQGREGAEEERKSQSVEGEDGGVGDGVLQDEAAPL